MELVIGAAIVGFVLALVLLRLIWIMVSATVDNGLDWLIHTFGNERAARDVENKWRAKEDR